MEEDIVGLDVCDGVIVAARVRRARNGALELRNVASAECPTSAGEQELAAAIRRVWREASMPSFTVCASFRRRSVVLNYFRYPALSSDELQAALRLEAEQSLQLPAEEVVYDWQVSAPPASVSPGASSRPYEGLLAAAPAKEVQEFVAVLRQAGLYPVVLDLGATALCNLFRTLAADVLAKGDAALLGLSAQSAEIVVFSEGATPYARTMYARAAGWDLLTRPLIESVQDALKYCEFKLRRSAVRCLYVTGRLPASRDFLAQMQTETGLAVELWDPLARVTPGSARARRFLGQRQTAPSSSVALGLALRRYDDA